MPQRYSVGELLSLRESPLVKRPDGLPPNEQWMGPPVDPNQRRPTQGRTRDGEAEVGARPSLLDTHVTRRSTTVAENIVLGPPKTAFASAGGRSFGKATPLDAADVTPSDNGPSGSRFFGKDQDFDDIDGERRAGRISGTNGRRNGKDDREDWNTRPRRTFDGDDSERRPRRDGQRWDSRKDVVDGDEPRRNNREEGRYGARPAQGRGKFEQPWFRSEGGAEPADDGKGQTREKVWGRDRRPGGATDNGWSSRPEQDPEWMDADPEGQQQAHTAEDFQKWKERMKADKEKPSPAAFLQQPLEGMSLEELQPAVKPAQLTIKPETDKFFELYGDKKTNEDTTVAAEAKKHKTRFASLFSPPPEPPKAMVEPKPQEIVPQEQARSPSVQARPASTDDDQAGFQRILAMLGGKPNNKSSVPPMEALFNPRPTQDRPGKASPNPLAGMFGGDNFGSTDAKPMARNSGGFESLLGPASPKPTSEKKNDSDFLLRLMQQSKMSPAPQQPPNQPPQSTHTPGILQMPEALNRSRQQMKSPMELPAFFNEPSFGEPQRALPRQEAQDDRHRYAARPPQMPNDYPSRPEYAKSPQDYAPTQPPPMQRPPGLDGPPPPGWPYQHQQPQPQQHQQQHPNQGSMHAPPGIPNPGSRGLPFPSGPPMSQHMNMPPPQQGPPQERQPQRKYTGGNAPFLPPGMQPPPGFIGNNGPPHGFPGAMPMPGNDPMLGMNRGGPPMGGNPQGMPPQHLMELFAMTGGDRGPVGRGPGGAAGMPGPYR